MVAQNPTATELQRVISVLQGAPEARIAQAILDAMVPAGSADVSGQVPGASSSPGPTVGAGTNVPATALPGGAVTASGGASVAGMATAPTVASGATVLGNVVPGEDGFVPNLPPSGAPGEASIRAPRSSGNAIDPSASPISRTGTGATAAVGAGAVSVALASSMTGTGQSAWITAGPDARSFLGALLALFGGTSRPTLTSPTSTPSTTLPQPSAQAAAGSSANQSPDRPPSPTAILARVIHDRLEYQQLGNAATLARGGWESGGTTTASTAGVPTPNTTNPGARPEVTASTFPANVPLPPPGDALNFSVPLAFAGQMATLELTVWRDGGRRQDAHEESTPGLHARMRLDLSQLGRVGADIRIAGQNLRCRLTAERDETNAVLQANGEALLDRLRDAGFTIEGLDYRPFAPMASGPSAVGTPSVVRRVDMDL
jgi:hypothetical protein